jgi:hypothetical protein
MSYIKPPDHPALSPDFCHPERRVKTAGEFGRSGITTWKTRGKYWRSDLAGGGGRLGEVWFGSFSSTAYRFLMISPNLHDIWAMFFLILSRYETLFSVGRQKIASAAHSSL